MVVQWVSQKFPDAECTPTVLLPYMLIIIFKKSLLKYSLSVLQSCSSGHETNIQKKTYQLDERKILWGEDSLTMFFEINYIGDLSKASLKCLSAIKEAAAEMKDKKNP